MQLLVNRRRPRTLRAHAAVLATVFLVGQLAGFVHRALVAHVTCPEHGEIIHSKVELDGSAHSHAPPCLRSASAPTTGHEHDVCLVVLHQRNGAVTTAAPTLEPTPPTPERTPGPFIALNVTPQSVYSLAPKTSPPV
jgi:hypothetical protein